MKPKVFVGLNDSATQATKNGKGIELNKKKDKPD